MLYNHIQCRGRLIRNDQSGVAGEGHCNDRPLLHSATVLMGISPHSAFWKSHELKKLFHSPKRFLFFKIWIVGQYGLCDLVLYPLDRIQGVHGGLKDHGNFSPTKLSHLIFALLEQIFSIKNDLATGDMAIGGQ